MDECNDMLHDCSVDASCKNTGKFRFLTPNLIFLLKMDRGTATVTTVLLEVVNPVRR